uniref:Melittin-like peptide n=1 Tax=Rana temporaria TaxID=8407 RepID=MLP_RANTE|nr:RecName: Full=Melittin-like peptide; Short=MLP [Rana temporaria]
FIGSALKVLAGVLPSIVSWVKQ